ncbi:MAG: ribosome recycling factor, partial [Pseudomonadota bacterium]
RNVRRDGMDQIKKAKAAGMAEDEQKMWSEEVENLTKSAIGKIDDALDTKQSEIMQV